MEHCDHGHEAKCVKFLPIGEISGVYVCYEHWKKELNYRNSENWDFTDDNFPAWKNLKKQSEIYK